MSTRPTEPTLPDPAGFSRMASELEALFTEGGRADLPEDAFGELALRAVALQLETNETYRIFCERRGVRPQDLRRWQDAPPVPATAFKHLDLVSGDPNGVETVFRTSGTTMGAGQRGRHLVPRLALYRASLLSSFRAFILPDDARLPLLSLIPSPSELPDSSLSTMIGTVASALCDEAHWLVDGEGSLDVDAFLEVSEALEREGRAALVTGTAFAFVHLLDALVARDVRVALPAGTRAMETGGFKGRSRHVRREELYARIEARLGVPTGRIVNEYGMTELLSQLYEPTLIEGGSSAGRHVPPPWMRVRALDPVSLEPLPPGGVGLLAFFDLANLGSVCHLLTEDLGSVGPDGVRLQGRTEGAEPRGCSRAMEDLMAAAEHRR